MKRVSVLTRVLFVAASVIVSAQAAAAGNGTTQPAAQVKGVNLAGRVSMDGRTLLADDDNHWAVSNAGALKGFEGRYVVVKCRMEPTKIAIRVFYVIEPELRHAANWGDSAFRR